MDTFINGQRVADTSTPNVPDTAKDATIDTVPEEDIIMEMKLRPFRRFFGEDTELATADEQINFVLKTLNPTGKLTDEELTERLKRMDTRIGSGELGEGKLGKIYRYVKMLRSVESALLENL